MSIPCKMRPVGLESLPMGYTRAEFLESSGTQYIYLDGEFTSTAAWSFSFTPTKIYKDNYFCGRNENYYAFAKIMNNLVAMGYVPNNNPVGFEPSTQEVYTVNFDILNKRGFISCRDEKKEWIFPGVPATKALVLFGGQSTSNNTSNAVSYKSYAKMWDIAVSHNGEKTHEFVPALDSTGVPCMFDTVSHQPFYNSGSGQFIVGLTMAQALNLANLPVTENGTLTVSLPLEAAFDVNVKSALDAASAKGWTIPVQYRASELTTKNIEADFLESTQPYQQPQQPQQRIDTGRRWNARDEISILYEPTKSPNYNIFGAGKYRMAATTSASEGVYFELPVKYPFTAVRDIVKTSAYYSFDELRVNEYSRVINIADFESTSNIFVFGNSNGMYPAKMRLYSYEHKKPNGDNMYLIPVIDSTGVPCMYDVESAQNFYNAAEGVPPFTVGFYTTEKAAVSLSKLPVTTGGELTVSLPAEAEGDELVDEACRIAASRGWTILPQYRED